MEKQEVTLESPIETALAKENVTAQVIAELKAKYSGLKINGLDDKAGFKAVEDARKECKTIRVLATKICKKGREEAVQIQKDWIAKEKEVVAAIEEVEGALEAESDRIKEEEKRILFEAAQQAKLPMRKEKLLSIGVEVPDAELLKIDDGQFLQLFNEFYEKHLEEKAEKQRQEDAKRQAEEKRIADEKEAELKKRKDALVIAGFSFDGNNYFVSDFKVLDPNTIISLSENEFETVVNAGKNELLRLKEIEENKAKKAAEEKAKVDAENARLKAENEAKEKALAEAKAKADAELKAEQEKAAKEKAEVEAKNKALQEQIHQKQLAEFKEKEEAEAKKQAELALGDKPKFEKMLQQLEDIKTKYEFKAAKYKTVQSSVNDLIDKTITYAKSKI